MGGQHIHILQDSPTSTTAMQVGDALLELKGDSVEDDAAETQGSIATDQASSATSTEEAAKGTYAAAQPKGEPQNSGSTQQASPTHCAMLSIRKVFIAISRAHLTSFR